MSTVLITGTSRGIGLELATQYAADGWCVLATCRNPKTAKVLQKVQRQYPDTVYLHALDVGDHEQIERLGTFLREESVDILINNAGWGEKCATLADVTYESWEKSMRINAYATLKMAQVFLEQLARSRKKTIVTISSQMGSIAQNYSGTRYAYRASKATVNMIVKTLSVDLSPKGIVVTSLHPGWVKTDLGGSRALISVQESVSGLRQVIGRLTQAESGRFFAYDGTEIPW
ncbi:MAG: SDR family oxidoreductase [Fischerella sp. CENA71]|nr:SDR family oxidoreductase [Fischerella sp. CENA71]